MPSSPLRAEEREEIRVALEAGESLRAIARSLGRAPSTISRELDRNGGPDGYRAARAQRRADLALRRPNPSKVAVHAALRRHVEGRLVALDSPTTISRELAAAGGIGGETISAETIYRGVYAHGGRGLSRGLHRYLHRQRRCRRPRYRGVGPAPKRRSPLGDFALITKRPPQVEDRSEPGHWEGDLIIGAGGRSAIATLVERTSRYSLLGVLPNGHGAEEVLACLVTLLARVPRHLRRSLTWDSHTGRDGRWSWV